MPTKLQLTPICEQMIASHFDIRQQNRAGDAFLRTVVQWTWKVKLHLQLENDLLGELREKAEVEAIAVFARNYERLINGSTSRYACHPGRWTRACVLG